MAWHSNTAVVVPGRAASPGSELGVDCGYNACRLHCGVGGACGPFSGFHVANAVGCDDGDECTVGDACSFGLCLGLKVPNCCHAVTAATDCDDNDACTTDACENGSCRHTAGGSCDDGDACTTDSCDPASGACLHAQMSCDDGNPCTTDECQAGSCINSTISGSDDGDGDGVPNEVDNCPTVCNPDQKMTEPEGSPQNPKGLGDACNPDIDGDGVPNAIDNCPLLYNPEQNPGDPAMFAANGLQCQ